MTSRSFTVLVIDDDPDVREVIAALLEAEGHVPVQAANGSEGLASARAQHPDLILLDLMMPVIDGWSFRRIQQAEPDLARIPTVVISAVAVEGDERLGPVTYLHKPFTVDALLTALARHCASG